MPFLLLFGTIGASCYGSIKLVNWLFSDEPAQPGSIRDKILTKLR